MFRAQASQSGSFEISRKKGLDINLLMELGILTPDEWAMLMPTRARYLVAYMWASALFRECADRGILCRSLLPRFDQGIAKVRDASHSILMFLNSQLPLVYIQLVSYVVHVFVFFQCSYLGFRLYVALQQPTLHQQAIAVFWTYFSTVTWIFTFEGLLVLNIFFSNPFGMDAEVSSSALTFQCRSTRAFAASLIVQF